MKCHQAETSDGPAEHFPRSRAGLTRSVEGEVEGRWMWKKDVEEVSRDGLTRSVEGEVEGRWMWKKDEEEVSRAGLTRSGEGQQSRTDAQRVVARR